MPLSREAMFGGAECGGFYRAGRCWGVARLLAPLFLPGQTALSSFGVLGENPVNLGFTVFPTELKRAIAM